MNQKLTVVKIGGAFLEQDESLKAFCRAFTQLEGPKILIHGGGARASELGNRLGIPPKMVDGRRITDAETLEIALMVYAGWGNKSLVAKLQALGCPALGLSGADADIIRAVKRPVGTIDFGWVGDVQGVNHDRLKAFVAMGLVPVCCALTHDGAGQMLNTNADTIAAEIAVSLSASYDCELIYCFDKPGVLTDVNDPGSLLTELNPTQCAQLAADGIIATGMLPKLHNGFDAMKRGVRVVRVGAPAILKSTENEHTRLHHA
ncbi:N-acetylglutamate kinase [Robiginitalea myxolifaciens]|uniref:Acetylglutamate kinase n=1 Tax=Robiginitalea myxolifaciens TaxID=400055 RepID=A0A1I6G9Z2_9FLAO|nr:acetylglutamate kinase [Robiginitalea myxolifaciens]SFR39013.1 N-acetylglutamate kinase [Robiginitalea myxolifaciens]